MNTIREQQEMRTHCREQTKPHITALGIMYAFIPLYTAQKVNKPFVNMYCTSDINQVNDATYNQPTIL